MCNLSNYKKEIKFCNLIFKGLNSEVLFKVEEGLKIIVTCNSEFIVKAQRIDRFRMIINNNYATFDGQIPYILAKLLNNKVDFEKISGSDLIYDFCEYAKNHNLRVFLLGGKEESNKLSIKQLKNKYGIDIDGYSPPYEPYPFSEKNNNEILKRISLFKPHIIFVGFGSVKQEYWIDDNKDFLEKIGVKFAIGCGGTFDFVAGKVKRAPKFIQKIGLEGVWRLINEPSVFRLKRLLISFLVFKYFFKEIIMRCKRTKI